MTSKTSKTKQTKSTHKGSGPHARAAGIVPFSQLMAGDMSGMTKAKCVLNFSGGDRDSRQFVAKTFVLTVDQALRAWSFLAALEAEEAGG